MEPLSMRTASSLVHALIILCTPGILLTGCGTPRRTRAEDLAGLKVRLDIAYLDLKKATWRKFMHGKRLFSGAEDAVLAQNGFFIRSVIPQASRSRSGKEDARKYRLKKKPPPPITPGSHASILLQILRLSQDERFERRSANIVFGDPLEAIDLEVLYPDGSTEQYTGRNCQFGFRVGITHVAGQVIMAIVPISKAGRHRKTFDKLAFYTNVDSEPHIYIVPIEKAQHNMGAYIRRDGTPTALRIATHILERP